MIEYLVIRLKSSRQRTVVAGFVAAATVAFGIAVPEAAWADNDHGRLKAVPFVFVGTDGNCGVAGANIVTAAWLGGMGLPDNGGANFNTATPNDPPNKRDRHMGLLLNKNGATPICSAAGAEITGVRGMRVTADFQLGFDYRNGGHCGGGAPRFNVSYRLPDGTDGDSFVGNCTAFGINTPAAQDPTEWTTIRFTAAVMLPPIPPGSRITSISILYDEGTDQTSVTPTSSEPSGVGLAVLDNIFINGRLITRGTGIADGNNRDKNDGRNDREWDDD